MKRKRKVSKAEYARAMKYWTRVAETFPEYEGFKAVVLATIDARVRNGHITAQTAAKIVKEIKEIEDRYGGLT